MRYCNLAVAATLCACGTALAQVDPPPTWGQDDGASLSLSYTFPTDAFQPVPDLSVAWDGWEGVVWSEGTVKWMPSLTDHNGVWGLPENDTGERVLGRLYAFIWNGILRPEKQVWYQFDVYVGPKSTYDLDVSTAYGFTIGPDTKKSEPLDNGWERITGSFSIFPQPPWEQFYLEFSTDPGGGPVAFDNFHIHTHCVPTPTTVALFSLAGLGAALRRRR
ncbi:MAG: PEP-CTERM sorting domain-containing protein [Phycisphaerales bacterium]